MKQYLDCLQYILYNGTIREDRTGTGTASVFGYQMRFDLSKGFPAVTTKKLAWKPMVSELLWFLEGSSDERRLCEILYGTRDDSKKTIWTENANASYWKDKAEFEGDCGRIYGKQWRSWTKPDGTTIDQIQNVIDSIKKDPYGRRHLVVGYNPGEIEQMALPPCHSLFQFYVSNGKLSCQLYQRSVDSFLGLPFNIASYALLTHMIAQICGLEVGEFIHTSGDLHIYLNHIDQVRTQLAREPVELPIIWINPEIKSIDKFTMDDVKIINYKHHPSILAKMAV